MADPLSMAASLIAVVQISGGIISLCYDYRRGVQGAKKDVATLQREVQSLRDVIEQILKLLDTEDEYTLPLLRKMSASNNSFDEYEEQFRSLEDRLRSPVSKWRKLGHQLLWPLRERELTKDLEAIHRMKGILEFGLVADTAFSIMEIRKDTRDLKERIRNFHREADLPKEQKLQVMLEWLGAPDPSFRHNELRRKRAKDTGSWLLNSNSFRMWHDSESSSFWLHGIPGCGKSVLSSTVIEHVRHHDSSRERDVALAYYHFDFSDEVISRPDLMLRSLISQLSSWNGEPPGALEKCAADHFYKSRYASSDRFHDGIAQPSKEDLINILRGVTEELEDVILVIDALDECIDQYELLEHLDSMLSWNTKGLRIFLSSRNTPLITSILDSKATLAVGAESANVGEDIKTFVQGQLKTHPKLRKWPASLRNEIHNTLTTGAHGMFRWVDCQLSTLGKCITTRDVKKALKALPKTLSETYASSLRSIDEAHWDYAIRILMFLALSPRPVTIGEAVDILAVDFETGDVPLFDEDLRMPDETDILAMCATLVKAATIRQLGTDGEIIELVELRLAHYTVKEYLLSEAFKPTFPHICPFRNEQEAYSYATQVSLAYLLDLQHNLSAELLEDRPFSRHAAELWTYYYQRSQPDSILIKLALQLFQNDGETEPYRNWCRLFDPSRPWRQPDIYREVFPSPLYYMCVQEIEPMVFGLLEAGADPNKDKRIYGTCLQSAASNGRVGLVKALLQAGANPNDSADDYQEGLYCNSINAASAAGHVEIVELLLQHGADPNNSSRFPTRGSALTEASRRNHVGVVELLINAGADPNTYHSKPRDVNPLEAAASRGHKECVALMLPKASKTTALGGLREAYRHESREVIETFIPFIPDGVMYAASSLGYEDLVIDLLAKGAKPETSINNGYRGEDDTASALSEACRAGHLQIVRRLIDNGADINAKSDDSSDGTYPLANAVFGGYMEIVDLLLRHGVDANTSGLSGPALQIACFKGHKEMVEALIKHGASLTCGDGRYGGPVQAVVLGNHLDVLELVVAAGADINLEAGERRIWTGDNTHRSGSAIQAAASASNMAMLNWLLDHGADVNIQGVENGFRCCGVPLAIAAEAGNLEMVHRLLEAGAVVDRVGKSPYSSPAIFEAAKKAHVEVVKCLLSAGADPNSLGSYYGDRITTLAQACMGKSEAVVEVLLEAGADVHVRNCYRDQDEPVLVTAAREGTIEIIRALVRHGADVNEQAKDGWTALHAAAKIPGKEDVVRALLFEFSADPSVPLVNGSLPIHTAASWGETGCIELLVEGGTDINARSTNGRTPLHWAAASEYEREDAIEWLLDHGADYALEEYGTNMTARDYVEMKAQKGVDQVKILEIFDAKTRPQTRVVDDLLDEKILEI
ncbi:ankyrin repeat-containing domain protein [Hypoxylon rubiginosum]|uniref:Ankyrin repeat-containing domain protein n=1 Tax=Hypoxylon rubiginosum TaxID=110542 RepID=A0ACB9Z2U1_9PEZI|nr:ankyrin repeat-containing domain protein [Hypoxylon rubiginosum]